MPILVLQDPEVGLRRDMTEVTAKFVEFPV
jgi:hypothetical protein